MQGSEGTPPRVGPGGKPPGMGWWAVWTCYSGCLALGKAAGEWRRSLGGAWRRRWETGPARDEERVQWPGAAECGGAVRPAREPK